MALVDSLLGGVLAVIDKVVPDPQAKAEMQLKVMQLQQSGDLAVIAGQVEINKIEAASPDPFRSGWRPAVGWVCVCGLAYTFLLQPLGTWIAAMYGHPVAAPTLDMEALMTLLIGMLGLGGMRTYEKVRGVSGPAN